MSFYGLVTKRSCKVGYVLFCWKIVPVLYKPFGSVRIMHCTLCAGSPQGPSPSFPFLLMLPQPACILQLSFLSEKLSQLGYLLLDQDFAGHGTQAH